MFILDVQGFQFKDSDFVCKEIAILNQATGQLYHHFINLPIPSKWLSEDFRRQVQWTTQNLHGLDWNSFNFSFLPLENITNFIQEIVQTNTVFVKGLNKKVWLCNLINNNIVDMDSLGCPNFKKLKTVLFPNSLHCNTHSINNLFCTRENVFLLNNWFVNKIH